MNVAEMAVRLGAWTWAADHVELVGESEDLVGITDQVLSSALGLTGDKLPQKDLLKNCPVILCRMPRGS